MPLRPASRRVPGREEGQGPSVFHFGTGNHHIVGLKLAENGSNNAVLGITASPQEYDDYVELLIKNPRLGHTYKAYFGDIYQLDAPPAAASSTMSALFHVGEFRTPENDSYGALTDLEMTLVLADKLQARRRDSLLHGLVRLRKGRGRRQEL